MITVHTFAYIDKKTDKDSAVYKWKIAQEVMKIGLETPELRDEIYVAVLREIDANPDVYVMFSLSFLVSFVLTRN